MRATRMTRPPKGIDEILVAGLGSPTKLRILMLLLAKSRDVLARYAIVKGAWASDRDALRILRALVELGWILEVQGKPVKYRLNRDNAIVGHLAEFFSQTI
jgi:DNA-binding transcriptional ArsR family regulator